MRLAVLSSDEMTTEQVDLYREILGGPRGQGPRAVLGGVIVAVIYNGLQLLGLGASPQYIWTAIVLLAAVTIDTVARRSQART